MIQEHAGQSLVNETSYTTGLCRDLHKHVFKLHPIGDEHDVKQQMTTTQFTASDISTSVGSSSAATAGVYKTFGSGLDTPRGAISDQISASHDMIYVRIHGRAAGNPTRLHYNMVSNQEIVFDNSERESRFHTLSQRVGNFDEHHAASRASSSASHMSFG